jgi:myo-inositol 2-dehydrogenase/D-chiro-inositol 1-dehydrogenase
LKIVRLGVIGLGAVAQLVYVPILTRRTDLFQVVAVADLSPTLRQVVGERLDVPAENRFEGVDQLLAAGNVDAVMVLTSGSHGSTVKAVTDAGLPVFVEKPMGWTLAELDRLAGREALVQVGYMKRFDPALQRLEQILAADAPTVRSVEVVVLHPSTERQVAYWRGGLVAAHDVPSEVRERFAVEGRLLVGAALGQAAERIGDIYWDVLLGSIIHDLAVLRAVVGDPVRVDWATVWPSDWTTDRLSFAAECQLPGDARLSIRWHYAPDYPEYREEVQIHAEEASYRLTFPCPYILNLDTRLEVTKAAGDGATTTVFGSPAESFEQQLESFHRTVAASEKPAIGLEEARADILTCQRLARALATSLGLQIGGEAAAVPAVEEARA